MMNGNKLLSLEEPTIIDRQLDWEIVEWSLGDWELFFDQEVLPFRCGINTCPKISKSDMKDNEHLTFKGFMDYKLRKDSWMYFDYKHLNEWIIHKHHLLKSISWAKYGFPERGVKESTMWIGTAGANTPCHMDTYGANIVAQIYGKKRWILLPPSETEKLKPTRIPYEESSVYSDVNFFCAESVQVLDDCDIRFIDLNAGDVLYVPPRWWHYVESVSTAISVNTWLPHPKDDEWRMEEALVRCLVSSVSGCLGKEARHILHPSELDVGSDLMENFKLLDYCTAKCEQVKRESELSRNVVASPDTYEISSKKIIRKINVHELIAMTKCRSKHTCERDVVHGKSKLECVSSMINHFCDPDVVQMIKNKILKRL